MSAAFAWRDTVLRGGQQRDSDIDVPSRAGTEPVHRNPVRVSILGPEPRLTAQTNDITTLAGGGTIKACSRRVLSGRPEHRRIFVEDKGEATRKRPFGSVTVAVMLLFCIEKTSNLSGLRARSRGGTGWSVAGNRPERRVVRPVHDELPCTGLAKPRQTVKLHCEALLICPCMAYAFPTSRPSARGSGAATGIPNTLAYTRRGVP